MNKNGWVETEFDGGDVFGDILAGMNTREFHKGHIKLLYTPNERHSNGVLWHHISMSIKHRYPTWDEILDARYTFFPDTAEVVQILPPKAEYVNIHKNCFHLYSPVNGRMFRTDEFEKGWYV